jgi:DNA-binding transcriptional ArsR family regulator
MTTVPASPPAAEPDLFAALSEPRRQAIVRLLLERGELAAGDIHRTLGEVTFGAVSQHLRVLERAGALSVRRDGRRRLYRARRAALRPVRGYLDRLWTLKLDQLKVLAEAEDAASAPPPNDDEASDDAEDEENAP